jgi:phage shock protein PspC (stress-responsive transcriptional regulator)
MHTVSEIELDAIASGGKTINLGFFGVCFGTAVSFGIVLTTATLPIVSKATFIGLFFAALVMGAYFGLLSVHDYRESKRKLHELKGSRTIT